jgi:hypothetical protein
MSAFFFFTFLSGSPEYTPWGDPGIERQLTPAQYGHNPTVYLEVHGQTDEASKPLLARLYNVTTAAAVAGSDISIASTTKVRARSGAFSLAAGINVYRVEFGGVPGPGGVYSLFDAVLLVDPNG